MSESLAPEQFSGNTGPKRIIAAALLAASLISVPASANASDVNTGNVNTSVIDDEQRDIEIARAEYRTSQDQDTEIISFCAPEIDSQFFLQDLLALKDIGVTSLRGPCRKPPEDYMPLHPGERYASPEEYMKLVMAAGELGMKVYIYDERLWANGPDRYKAIKYWLPVKKYIAGIDTGDEPNVYKELLEEGLLTGDNRAKGLVDELPEFNDRWRRLAWPMRRLGIQATTNMAPLGEDYQLEVLQALRGIKRIEFNDYTISGTIENIDYLRSLGVEPVPSAGTHGLYYDSPEEAANHLRIIFGKEVNGVVLFPGANPLVDEGWAWNPLVQNGKLTKYGIKFKEVIAENN